MKQNGYRLGRAAQPIDERDDHADGLVLIEIFVGHGNPELLFDGGEDLETLQGIDGEIELEVGVGLDHLGRYLGDPGDEAYDFRFGRVHGEAS